MSVDSFSWVLVRAHLMQVMFSCLCLVWYTMSNMDQRGATDSPFNGYDFIDSDESVADRPRFAEDQQQPLSIGDNHRALTDLVCEELRRQIVTGVRRPGERLVEKDLAAEFKVSRNPARETLRMLSTEGFVKLLPRRGALVAVTTSADAEYLFEVRLAFETAASGLAARRLTKSSQTVLLALLDEGDEALARKDLERMSDLNSQFHNAIVEASGNPYLAKLFRPVHWKVQWLFEQSVQTRAHDSCEEHRLLVQAIIEGKEEEARSCAAYHIARAADAYRRAAKSGSSGDVQGE